MVNTKRALSSYQSGKLVSHTLSRSTKETPSAVMSSQGSSSSRILPRPGDRTGAVVVDRFVFPALHGKAEMRNRMHLSARHGAHPRGSTLAPSLESAISPLAGNRCRYSARSGSLHPCHASTPASKARFPAAHRSSRSAPSCPHSFASHSRSTQTVPSSSRPAFTARQATNPCGYLPST